VRPAEFCRGVMAAIEAADGRRRKRKRDTTPDTVGLALYASLVTRAIADDPPAEDFERWLEARVREAGLGSGPLRATALRLFDEWRLACADPSFLGWLARGAPSDDVLA
jgi:hypothetical protein